MQPDKLGLDDLHELVKKLDSLLSDHREPGLTAWWSCLHTLIEDIAKWPGKEPRP